MVAIQSINGQKIQFDISIDHPKCVSHLIMQFSLLMQASKMIDLPRIFLVKYLLENKTTSIVGYLKI